MAEEITKSVADGIDLKGYFHIFNPQCFKHAFGETLVNFFDLTNPVAVKEVQMVVNQYYDLGLTFQNHSELFLQSPSTCQFHRDLKYALCGMPSWNIRRWGINVS